MKKIALILLTLFIVSCNDYDKEITLNVTDIQLTDAGQIPFEFRFDAEPGDSGIQKCTIRTLLIKKNDTIQSITASAKGNNLNIEIISSPFDFDCNDISCFTVHDVNFNLNGLHKGEYRVCTDVNNSEIKEFSYKMK